MHNETNDRKMEILKKARRLGMEMEKAQSHRKGSNRVTTTNTGKYSLKLAREVLATSDNWNELFVMWEAMHGTKTPGLHIENNNHACMYCEVEYGIITA